MYCKTCSYPLWNITARQCPECGAPFKPSDYEFTLNSVQFCCPHCRQAYYGTGEQGHLIPRGFTCVSCAQPIDMDEMVLLPTAGVTEAQTVPDTMPWLDRSKIGFFRGYFGTVGKGMAMPGRLIQVTPIESSVGHGLLFMLITVLTAVVLGLGILMIFPLIAMVGARGAGGMSGALGMLLLCGGYLIGWFLFIMLWACVTHGILRLGGQCESIGRTMQCICYSSGPYLLAAVPCIGAYLSTLFFIWWMVSATLMVKQGHKIGGGRAALATLMLPGLLILSVVGLFVVGIASAFRVAGTAGPGGWQSYAAGPIGGNVAALQAHAQSVTTALRTHVLETGKWPAHAIELVDGNPLTYQQISVDWDGATVPPVTIQSIPLADFTLMPDATQKVFVQRVIAQQPTDVVAHRLGDYVFTYHGIDFATADPVLWIVIQSPDPGRMTSSPPVVANWVVVGQADGSVTVIPAASFSTELAAQNQIRAGYGLSPLPDPATVQMGIPAQAPPP